MRYGLSMRHLAPLIALLASVLAAAAPAHAASRQSVRVVECTPALDQIDRVASFEARMRTLAGAEHMEMRFTLQMRVGSGARWRAVSAPGFGRWVSSDAGVARYVYTKRVANLVAPASYRTRVRFRWLDASGRRLDSALALSPVCTQPDLRPDLHPLSIDVAPAGQPDRALYTVPLLNRGRSATGPFEVTVSVDGQPLPAQAVEALEPGERRSVTVNGPRCRQGSSVTAEVDSGGTVDERVELDNRFTRACGPS